MLGCTACDTFTLRVYAHVIRKHADEVADTFAAAVDGDTEAAATDPDEDDPEDPVQVACEQIR